MFCNLLSPGRRYSKALGCLTLVGSLTCANIASANEICMQMNLLLPQAQSNFLARGTSDLVEPDVMRGADTCRMIRSSSGGNTFHCAWKFGYREKAAIASFNKVNQQLNDCFAQSIQRVKDEGVNHPDSYQQSEHVIDEVTVSVSIKDKGALQETYVFVGVQGRVAAQ